MTVTVLTGLAGLGAVGALAACSTTPAGGASGSSPLAGGSGGVPSAAASPPVAVPGGQGEASGSTFKDGSYTATGDYLSPGGPESVTVTLTIADDVVTAVQVVSGAHDPTAKQFQQQFIGGIQGVVVGKRLADLQVDKVSGSSLTSQGFNDALKQIEEQARA